MAIINVEQQFIPLLAQIYNHKCSKPLNIK